MSCSAPFATITTNPYPRYGLDTSQNQFWHTNTTLYVKLNWAPAAATPVKATFYLSTRNPVTGGPTRLLFRPNVTSLIFTSTNWTRIQPIRYILSPDIQNKTAFTPEFYDINPTLAYLSGSGTCYKPAPSPASITTRLTYVPSPVGSHGYYAPFSWWY